MQGKGQVSIDLPLPDERVFRYASMDDLVHLLVNAPHDSFTVATLARRTGYDESMVYRSVDLLQELGVVTVSDGRPSRVAIDHDHLECDDPLLLLPQAEFRAPVRAYLERLRAEVDDVAEIDELAGVVLFGSVARGEADRASDIDLLVVVDGDRTRGRRTGTAVARAVESERFDGDRYEFEVLVESVESAERVGEKLRRIFDDGVVLHATDALEAVRTAVYAGEGSTSAD